MDKERTGTHMKHQVGALKDGSRSKSAGRASEQARTNLVQPKKLNRRLGEHPCEDCGDATDLRGWYFVTPSTKAWTFNSSHKEYHWWCREHFIWHMFNLVSFECSKRCQKAVAKSRGCPLVGRDLWVWVDLLVATQEGPREPHPTLEIFRMVSAKVCCPHCGKPMKQVAKPRNRLAKKRTAPRRRTKRTP